MPLRRRRRAGGVGRGGGIMESSSGWSIIRRVCVRDGFVTAAAGAAAARH